MESRLNIKFTILIPTVLFFLSVFTSAFACKNLYLTVFTYGFLFGVGGGLKYSIGLMMGKRKLIIGMRWFPKKKGLVNGIVLAAYGISTTIFNPLITYIVNPKNKSIPEGVICILYADGLFSIGRCTECAKMFYNSVYSISVDGHDSNTLYLKSTRE